MLSRCNPESTVVCEARSEALLVIGRRTGMHEAWPDEPLALNRRGRRLPVRSAHTQRPVR